MSTDVKRPAAIQQLNVVAQKAGLGVRVHDPAGQMDPVARAKGAVAEATNLGYDVVIVDSAGRLHIDDELMSELEAIRDTTQCVGSAVRRGRDDGAGRHQERGRVQPPPRRQRRDPEQARRRRARWRGAVGRGGRRACRSRSSAAASGWKISSSSIPIGSCRGCSGMGDVLSLIERAEQAIDIEEAQKLEEKVRKDDFTLEDFREQLQADQEDGARSSRSSG